MVLLVVDEELAALLDEGLGLLELGGRGHVRMACRDAGMGSCFSPRLNRSLFSNSCSQSQPALISASLAGVLQALNSLSKRLVRARLACEIETWRCVSITEALRCN